MATFDYEAYDSHGTKLDGQIDAESKESVKRLLSQKKLTVVKITTTRNVSKKRLSLSQKVKLSDLEFVTSELAILLTNGVKVDKSLSILKKNKPDGPLANLLEDLYSSIKRGETLSSAMSARGDVFDSLYINLVKLGEESGDLATVFSRLSEDLKFRSDLQRNIIQSLTYPLVIFSVCILCILFIFNYIVPQMSGLFEGLPELPVYTEILLGTSEWMQQYQFALLVGIILMVTLLVAAVRNPTSKRRLDEVFLKIPFIRGPMLVVERIRFNSALAMMLEGGVSIDRALDLASGSVKNEFVSQGLLAANESIKKGDKLTDSLSKSPIYPDFYLSLLEVGEESGNLASIFNEIATRSKKEFESWTSHITSILEPLLILTMGGIVGSVVVTMLLSIISVNDVGF